MDAYIVRELTQEELDKLVYTVFPQWSAYSFNVLKGGLFNTTYLLESPDSPDGKKYVLRIGPVRRELLLPYEHYLMDAEAWAYEKMAEVGIPTSVVVHADTSKTLIDRDFMVVEYIPSRGLNRGQFTEEEYRAIYTEVGRYCRMMNGITTEKFGRVGHILSGGGSDTWSGYIARELDEWADSIRKNTRDYYTEEELSAIVSCAHEFADILDEIKVPMFNHCDMWSLNVLVPDSGEAKVAAIIDPDRCCMGDPDFELASGWMVNDAFLEGYGRTFSGDRNTRIRVEIYRMMFEILNGYFMWVQYEDKSGAAGDRERGLARLEKIKQIKNEE